MSFRDSSEFKRGAVGERFVAELLRRKGWYTIASYDFAGSDGEKAPRMHGSCGSYVLPDLDGSRAGKRVWIEVKTKQSANFYRIKQRLEHGIPWRHFQDYLAVEKESGCAVWLAVYEEDTGEVLMQSMKKLLEDVRFSSSPEMGKMAFFARTAFVQWRSKEEATA